ncbi:MAG: hypothetical protein EOO14_01370 [Chitinophagaceae bacterium]|nr:MAG: hypothetical protein EOO14_01370 [Chitinophagaceae bacterium]
MFVSAEVAASLHAMLSEGEIQRIDWIILKRGKMRNTTIIYQYCRKRKVNVLWLGTVAYHYLLFGTLCCLLRKTKTILTIHDANSFFEPKPGLQLRSSLNFMGKRLLAKSVNGFSTLLTSTKTYIENKYKPRRPISCIPGSFFNGMSGPREKDMSPLVIVIPGSVDTKRRDFAQLFEMSKQWHSQNKKLEIILLGGARDTASRSVLEQLKKMSTPALTFITYQEAHISQEEYDRQLERCDFVYAPLQKTFAEESALPEQYGYTKSSGCFFDAVRFGKPLLLPAAIFLPDELAPQTIVHSSPEDLIHFITHLTSEDLHRIHREAIDKAKRFALENIARQLDDFLTALPKRVNSTPAVPG